MSIILILVMVSQMYTCVKPYQVVYFKPLQFVNYTSIKLIKCVCLLFCICDIYFFTFF